VQAVSVPAQIKTIIRRYLKWYSVPLIYFLLTSLLCGYAWYARPIPYRAGIKAVFKTISLVPTLILTGTITAWILVAILLIPILPWLKKRFPELSLSTKAADFSQEEEIQQEQSSSNKPLSFWEKTVNASSAVLGVVLIVAGLSIALWVVRPYITFLFSTSKIETLEKKAELLGQVQTDETKKSVILGKTPVSQEQGQRDQINKIEASEITAEVPEQGKRDETKQGGVLQQKAELIRKDVTKKNEAVEKTPTLFERVRRDVAKRTMENQMRSEAIEKSLEKSAAIPGQIQKDWMIIPTVLVDAEILDGVNTKNLSLGVCRVSKSAVPGQGGNCIIEGHNLGDFKWWRSQGPFNMLEVLEKGVSIYIFYNGKKYVYKVKEITFKDEDDPKLYDFTPGERLTLITCASTWSPTIDTDKRLVIVAYSE
jgi:LPXTG-site transpeptidase (sortase) family protein